MPIRDDVRQKRRRGGRDADQRIFIAATLIPTALGLFIFWIYPLANGLWGSFTDWRAFQTDRNFIGLDNYRTLWNDNIFRETLLNTAQYTLMYLPLNVAIGLMLALAIENSGSTNRPSASSTSSSISSACRPSPSSSPPPRPCPRSSPTPSGRTSA
jgi:ABC-type sugar transport system permease subunit